MTLRLAFRLAWRSSLGGLEQGIRPDWWLALFRSDARLADRAFSARDGVQPRPISTSLSRPVIPIEPSEKSIELAPSELMPDDLVLVSATWARVLDEAMTMHRGLGMFDDFQVFVGARIEFVGQAGPRVWQWAPGDRVHVRRMTTDPPTPVATSLPDP